jgi:Uma2 family endonuclease
VLRLEYENAADAYLRWLREEHPEHFMEATPQAYQRKITLESFDVISVDNPEVQLFNELLVQYPFGRPTPTIRQVVPDNMVVKHHEPLRAVGSYNLPLQPARPFCVMEYVSKSSQRKDYEESFQKYERELKVPYYLLFYPDEQELTLFQHTGRRYRTVTPNDAGRYPIPELDLEVGLLDGWVRYWYKGELLPLPADLLRALADMRQQLRQAQEQTRLAEEETRQAQEQARLATEQARLATEQAERLRARLRELGVDPEA